LRRDLCHGIENIYTFGPTFRAEKFQYIQAPASSGWFEPEMAFCDINGNMDFAEEFLKYIFRRVLERCRRIWNSLIQG
jgi:asparaginyl-tRNA synthetase